MVFSLTWHFPNRTDLDPEGDRRSDRDRQLLRDAVQGCLGRGREGRSAGLGELEAKTAAVRPGVLRQRPAATRSRRPRCSTSARCARRPASAPPTAASSAGRAAATRPAAATARARTCGTTSRRRRSSSASLALHDARGGVRPRHRRRRPHGFRVNLPLDPAPGVRQGRRRRADGLPPEALPRLAALGDDGLLLRRSGPHVRKAVEFCWIPGGWDADKDGVMEGCQHNTMDVEYYGPNPQMAPVVPRGAAGGGGDGAARRGRRVRRDAAAACSSSGAAVDRRAPLQRRVLRARRSARPRTSPRSRPSLLRGDGGEGPRPSRTTSSAPAAWWTSSSASSSPTSAASGYLVDPSHVQAGRSRAS